MARSHVVTGGGRGIGRAIVERLLADGDAVAAVELDPAALEWLDGPPRGSSSAVPCDGLNSIIEGRK